MNLKTTYFNFAKHSEALGELKPSLRRYMYMCMRSITLYRRDYHVHVYNVQYMYMYLLMYMCSLFSYERAEAPLEIMRMLNNDGDELEAYVMASKDQ